MKIFLQEISIRENISKPLPYAQSCEYMATVFQGFIALFFCFWPETATNSIQPGVKAYHLRLSETVCVWGI